jgi:hypothetical protein
VGIQYKNAAVGQARLDLLVGDCLVVELKAVEYLLPIHPAQLLSYLKATGQRLGLSINFNVCLLREGLRRVILDPVTRHGHLGLELQREDSQSKVRRSRSNSPATKAAAE